MAQPGTEKKDQSDPKNVTIVHESYKKDGKTLSDKGKARTDA